jgi:hypothetical protein
MHNTPSDLQLEELEREVGPTLRAAWRSYSPRAAFAAELRQQLQAISAPRPRGHLHLVPRPLWPAFAAALAVAMTLGAVVLAYRPQTVSAEEAVQQLQTEAVGMLAAGAGACTDGPGTAGFAISQAVGAPDPTGKVTSSGGPGLGSTELSDRLAQVLGVSGDRVRQAMLDTVRADMPTNLPPDPMAAIAKQLGVSREQVCAAFFDGQTPGAIAISGGFAKDGPLPPPAPPLSGTPTAPRIQIGGPNAIDLTTATADQLSGPAQRLGVSSDRLLAAVRAAVPSVLPTPPKLPNPDEIIDRFAQNLGMSSDKVRAAITQVEGPNRFYFSVGIPNGDKR